MSTALVEQTRGIEIIPLSNGSTLYFKRFEGAPRIALNIYIHGGNRIEAKPGITDMIDSLISEGTERRDAETLAIEIDSLSLEVDTDTRRDYSNMSATFLFEDIDASLELMADMLFNSTFEEFEKEKIRMHGELIMELDSPRNLSHDLFISTILEGSPYQASRNNMLTTLPELKSVTPLQEHYRNVYQPSNMMFTIVGDLDVADIAPLIERYFQAHPGELYDEYNTPKHLHIPKNRIVSAAKDGSNQLHVFQGWMAPTQHNHADYFPMVILNTVLGAAGLSSRLFLELRDKQGLAYNVRSQLEYSRFLGLFYLYIGTEPSNREKVLKGFDIECQKLMDTPLTAAELQGAIENHIGRHTVFLETGPQQCSYLGSKLVLGISLDDMANYFNQIHAVTPADVQRVAQHYLSQPSVTAMVGPADHLPK